MLINTPTTLPLAGLRVVEFTHMVMGPTCGMILADLGAEVIKVEPIAGDSTRKLMGSGAGFFSTFNRNKKSIAVDVKNPKGQEIVLKLIAGADVFSENFKSGTMDKLGFGYKALSALNPGLIYISHKGFLPGPYEHRTALDEVVQMMGGLAYMTGPEGRPLRAGSSVNYIMGGMFGAIGALAALAQRHATGKGQEVQSALYENNVLLVAQHMMQFAVTGKPAAPMPSRISAWAVYDVFTVKDNEQVFLSAVSDTQWHLLCDEFGFADLKADDRLKTNNDRVERTPEDFVFDVKAFRLFTGHQTNVDVLHQDIQAALGPQTRPLYYKDVAQEVREELWRRFKQALWPLKAAGKLGAVLFQFPPWLLRNQAGHDHVAHCVEQMDDFAVSVEFRNQTWWAPEHRAATLRFEQELGVTHVVVDGPQGFANSVPAVWEVTNPKLAIFRLHGRNTATWNVKGQTAASDRFNYDYSEAELQGFLDPVRRLASQVDDLHVVFNNNYEDQGQRNARTLMAMTVAP